MKIISVTSQKGGTGKSTMTMLLACCLAADKYKVSILDIDTQSTIKKLSDLEGNKIVNICKSDVDNDVKKELLRFENEKYDFVFLDFPRFTHKDEKAVFLLSICDFVFVPSLGSIIEVLSTMTFIEVLKKLEVRHFVFLNKYRRLKEENETIEILRKESNVMANVIQDLKLFKDVSLSTSVLSTKEGKKRFEVFYNEFKCIVTK